MKRRILLVNPPIHDFSAFDFWLKPFGMLRVAGYLAHAADFQLFDYLDRLHPRNSDSPPSDSWGRGVFPSMPIDKPSVFADVPRKFRRFGLPRELFRRFLVGQHAFDFALVQTVITYWYPGVREVIEDIRSLSPQTKIVLGGVYATLCPSHAESLGADLVVHGSNLDPLWSALGVEPDRRQLPPWNLYPRLDVGVLKLANGCPFRCTYCSVPQVDPDFVPHPLERSLAELDWLYECGARNIAFYDDALLYRPEKLLLPFLEEVMRRRYPIQFHTPNALNARFITREIAQLLVNAGFRTFYLGFESSAYDWQHRTGGKVYSHELVRAIDNLTASGASRSAMTAYLIVGHPQSDQQDLEVSLQFANAQGIRVMLSEFSPIPGTPDGENCRRWTDIDEPLNHNKTAFAFRILGSRIDHLKALCRSLNRSLATDPVGA